MISFLALKDGYERSWANLKIRASSADQANKAADRLLHGKATYQQVETKTGVPWWFVGLCHSRESDFNFNTYLGNGQRLDQVTTIVPIGRGPFTGPNAFVDGAVDALRNEGFVGCNDWSIARTLYRLEGFNGYGYHGFGVNSPYLYGGSTLYGPPEAKGGKYVRDHVFDPNTVDPQLGTAVILAALMVLDPSISFEGASPPVGGSTEPDEDLAQAVLLIQQSLNKLGVADPRLTEDGINGPKTKAAIVQFQRQSGLNGTGLPDAATIAAITKKASQIPAQISDTAPRPAPIDVSQLLLQLQNLVQTLQSTTASTPKTTDPVSLIERLLAILPKATPVAGTTTSTTADASNVDQLKQAIDFLVTILGKGSTPALGQVNGALGDTIGNLLNGKKTAIGIGGSLLTTLLAHVTSDPTGGGLGGLLGMIATAVPGLSQFTLPIFLAISAWGVLGKMEKWAQGTAPPPKPQT
jgi:lysozyme family protein/peptidoglycan hydrolase-like protein with peptidoglycan-binding domain